MRGAMRCERRCVLNTKLRCDAMQKSWRCAFSLRKSSAMRFHDAKTLAMRCRDAGHSVCDWQSGNHVSLRYFAHANLVLERLFDFKLMDNTPGGKDLVKGEPGKPGCFDRSFKVCAGIERLNEGVTICYPSKVQPGWRVFGTSSNGHPVLLAKEASSERRGRAGTGRVIVDNGFTKIYKSQWTSAGTPRLVRQQTAASQT